MLLAEEFLANNVGSEPGLYHQRCRVLYQAFFPLEICSRDKTFDYRLNLNKTESHAFVVEAGFEASKDALNIDNEVLLGHLEAQISIPPLIGVDHKQVLDYVAQFGVTHQTRVVNSSIG